MFFTKKTLDFNADNVIKASQEGIVYLAGDRLTEQELKNLDEEIKYIKTMRIYNILFDTVREQARLVMFEKAKDFDDMRAGKSILYSLSVFENIFKVINIAVVQNKKRVLK